MVNLPWRSSDADDAEAADPHGDTIVVCDLQDGTLAVYPDRVVLERASRSKFADKTILHEEIIDVEYSGGITIGYVQIEQVGFDVDEGGMLSDPVNENTLHFGRSKRECVREARDAILERARG